jgi:hypothetical protein
MLKKKKKKRVTANNLIISFIYNIWGVLVLGSVQLLYVIIKVTANNLTYVPHVPPLT